MRLNLPTALVLVACIAGYVFLVHYGQAPKWLLDAAGAGGFALMGWLRSLRIAPTQDSGKTPPETPAAKVQS